MCLLLFFLRHALFIYFDPHLAYEIRVCELWCLNQKDAVFNFESKFPLRFHLDLLWTPQNLIKLEQRVSLKIYLFQIISGGKIFCSKSEKSGLRKFDGNAIRSRAVQLPATNVPHAIHYF